ncbi:MAG: hypothetical protein K2X98_06470 [Alphaproteobacteria bacterium]|nr:hypothetical protein [Alphaproteobacteria bacterium]
MKKIILITVLLVMFFLQQGFSSQKSEDSEKPKPTLTTASPFSDNTISNGDIYVLYHCLCQDLGVGHEPFCTLEEGQILIQKLFAGIRTERDEALEKVMQLKNDVEELNEELIALQEVCENQVNLMTDQLSLIKQQSEEAKKNSEEQLSIAKEDAEKTRKSLEMLAELLSK